MINVLIYKEFGVVECSCIVNQIYLDHPGRMAISYRISYKSPTPGRAVPHGKAGNLARRPMWFPYTYVSMLL